MLHLLYRRWKCNIRFGIIKGEKKFSPFFVFVKNISYICINKNVKEMISDNLDYDGMGNFGRFPASEKKVKKSLELWKTFRIFVSNKFQKSTKNRVS